jgi:ribosomal-protein-alanine N-acetyltransferase
MKYLDRPRQQTIEEAKEIIDNFTAQQHRGDSINWAITLKGADRLTGTICFWNVAAEHFRAEIGYMLMTPYHRQGLMQEALTKVLEFGFMKMQLHSVEANVNPSNEASIRLLKKNNFIREAYFRENFFYDGKFLDTAIYSLVGGRNDIKD